MVVIKPLLLYYWSTPSYYHSKMGEKKVFLLWNYVMICHEWECGGLLINWYSFTNWNGVPWRVKDILLVISKLQPEGFSLIFASNSFQLLELFLLSLEMQWSVVYSMKWLKVTTCVLGAGWCSKQNTTQFIVYSMKWLEVTSSALGAGWCWKNNTEFATLVSGLEAVSLQEVTSISSRQLLYPWAFWSFVNLP